MSGTGQKSSGSFQGPEAGFGEREKKHWFPKKARSLLTNLLTTLIG